MTNYLYIAQESSNVKIKKHHVFKVGYSSQPTERIKALGGSGSTLSYEAVLILELPFAVKDIHILSHRLLDPYVLFRHDDIQAKYLKIFGSGHKVGIKRRREIVMFGSEFTLTRIKALFRKVVSSMCSSSGTYICTDKNCLATGGIMHCSVCVKFMKSLVNSITYQPGVSINRIGRKRKIEASDTIFTQMIEQTHLQKRQKWAGPNLGEFWVLRPDTNLMQNGCPFLVARIQSRSLSKRTSRVQWWSCTTDGVMNKNSTFVPDTNMDVLPWDGCGWQCNIQTKQHSRFMRIIDIDVVKYYARQWRVGGNKRN